MKLKEWIVEHTSDGGDGNWVVYKIDVAGDGIFRDTFFGPMWTFSGSFACQRSCGIVDFYHPRRRRHFLPISGTTARFPTRRRVMPEEWENHEGQVSTAYNFKKV